MKRNMGLEDRTIRPIVAMGLIGLCFSEKVSPIAKIALLTVSSSLIITSLVGKCPAYEALGINTRKTWEDGAQELFS